MTTEYVCKTCGKSFPTKQGLCGHQRYHSPNFNRSQLNVKEKNLQLKLNKLDEWIHEQHTCKRCGKIMTEKFGSGTYCSRKCSNSRERNIQTRQRISESTKQTLLIKDIRGTNIRNYNKNPKYCCICNSPISYNRKEWQTCGNRDCILKLQSKTMIELTSEQGLHNTVYDRRMKWGVYNGFRCDSSWELAYLMWCLDHHINITRNTNSFPYTFNNEKHNYFPDFIVNDHYVEIKGRYTEEVYAKIKCFPKDKILEMIDSSTIVPYLKYCEDTYGKDFYRLYDRNYPSWMDKIDAE